MFFFKMLSNDISKTLRPSSWELLAHAHKQVVIHQKMRAVSGWTKIMSTHKKQNYEFDLEVIHQWKTISGRPTNSPLTDHIFHEASSDAVATIGNVGCIAIDEIWTNTWQKWCGLIALSPRMNHKQECNLPCTFLFTRLATKTKKQKNEDQKRRE